MKGTPVMFCSASKKDQAKPSETAFVLILFPLALLFLLSSLSSCHKEEEKYAQTLVKTLDQGKIMSTKNSMDKIAFSLNRYMADTGGYPEGENLDPVESALTRGYVQEVVKQDAWKNKFRYSSDGRGYTLVSAGDDEAFDTKDDIVMVDGVYR